MTQTNEALKFPAGNPLDALTNLITMARQAKESRPLPSGDPAVQIASELAYKLVQAVGQAKDPELFQESLLGLLDATAGIIKSLRGKITE